MKKYCLITFRKSDGSYTIFESKEEAIEAARREWNRYTTTQERKEYLKESCHEFYVGLFDILTDPEDGEPYPDEGTGPDEIVFDVHDFETIPDGATYEDPDGVCKVLDVDAARDSVLVECIQDGNPNKGREYNVTPYEVLYYLNGGK